MLLRTSCIRAFVREDIPEVTDLWLQSFRESQGPASPEMKAYFDEVFFNNPWHDEHLPSLVYQNDQGRIVGFLGVLPRPMVYREQPIRAAVATQLMVDRRFRGFAAMELLRRFFAGKQDLCFSDGATEAARRVWERSGGQTVRLYCFEWMRIVRPAEAVLLRVQARGTLGGLARLGRPLVRGLDAMGARLPPSPYCLPEPEGTVDEAIAVEDLLACIASLSARQVLRPQYDRESLSWVLRLAGQARSLGALRSAVIRDASGAVAGWCIYYLKRGDLLWVVQFGAEPGQVRFVLNHLFAHAQRCGAVGVCGQIDPCYMGEMASERCRFYCPGLGVLVQSKNEELLNAIRRGDGFITRLEGEWWLRFGIDRHADW